MSEPTIDAKVQSYLHTLLNSPQALRGQQLRGGGPVADFERLLAARCGFSHCVATCNATTALLGLAAMFRVWRRPVWFPESHWQGSAAAFRLMGAKVRYYHPQSLPSPCRRVIGTPMLLVCGGDCDTVAQGVMNKNCIVVEDSSRIPGISTAMDALSHADVQILSFGPGKPLSLGEGGAALFRTAAMKNRFLSITQHPERLAIEIGARAGSPRACLNGRIHPLAALIGAELLMTLEGADLERSAIIREQNHPPILTPTN